MAVYSHNANSLMPLMTANNAPSPIVVSAYNTSGSYLPYLAFDREAKPLYFSWVGDVPPGWIKVYTGGDQWVVTSYTLTSWLSGYPIAWTLSGSNNDTDWITLDTRSGVSFTSNFEMQTFSVTSPGAYKYYKLNITSTGAGNLSLAEWELIGSIAVQITGDVTESSESTDSNDSFVGITVDVSESSTSTDEADGTKDFETCDIDESSVSTDSVDGFQDYSIGDVVESSESTDTVTGASYYDADVDETSTSTDTVVAYDMLVVDVAEVSVSSDTSDVTNTSIDDVSGIITLVVDMSIVDITGAVGGFGTVAVECEVAEFVGTGKVGSVGVGALESESVVFVGSGLVNATGSLEVECGKGVFGASGLVGNYGSLGVVTGKCEGAISGLVNGVGVLEVTGEKTEFAGSGWSNVLGTMSVVSGTPALVGSGLVENAGTIACVAEESSFAATGAVGSTGVFSATAILPVFFAKDSLTAVVQAFCLNLLKKGLVSKFTNYDFNSFAMVNGVLLGAKSTGLFKLVGEDDDSTDIAAVVEFPLAKFGTTKTKQLRAVKMFGRSDGDLLVTANDGKGNEWEVTIPMTGDDTAESLVGYFPFTARGRYLQLVVENVAGSDFLLDQVELSSYILGRA